MYVPISSQTREIVPFNVQTTNLQLQDYKEIMLGPVTMIDLQDLFRLEQKEKMPYEHSDNVWVSVTIEMSLHVLNYDRYVYTLFDMLSDIGGLSGILFSSVFVLMKLWNYNNLENYLISRLFRI